MHDTFDFSIDDKNESNFYDCSHFEQLNQTNRDYTIYFDDNYNNSHGYFHSTKSASIFKRCVSKNQRNDIKTHFSLRLVLTWLM